MAIKEVMGMGQIINYLKIIKHMHIRKLKRASAKVSLKI
jgi:hypothetical protein